MFDIKRARNNFYGFRATLSAADFDGFLYVLDAAEAQYKEAGSDKLEGCQKLIRVLTELAYFDPEKREVHVQLGFRELESFTQAMFDVMLSCLQPEPEHSFDTCLQRPGVKIWTNRQPTAEK